MEKLSSCISRKIDLVSENPSTDDIADKFYQTFNEGYYRPTKHLLHSRERSSTFQLIL